MPQFESDGELGRGDLYKLLATVFLEAPTDAVLREFEGIDDMAANASVHEVAHDFHDLFAHNQVPLYESFYNYPMGEGPRSWGSSTGDVQRFYESKGLAIGEDQHIAPDHIATELLFMSYLAENDFVDEQGRFLKVHMMKWVPVFCDEVHAHAKTEFYREIAILLKELVSSDYEELGGI
jgi:putative dimethyl sulfoxide reductase chaperone